MRAEAGPHSEIGIFAKTFQGASPHAVLTQARDAGFSTVQYNMKCSGLNALPRLVPDSAIAALRDACRDTGVGIAALSATFNMIHPDVAVRASGHEALHALAGVAQTLGIPVLTLCIGSRNTSDQWALHPDNANADAWRDLLDGLTAALNVAERFNVVLGIEPEPSNVVDSAATARRVIDEMGSARLGVVIDAANLIEPALNTTAVARRDVITRAIDLLADRIVLVHAKDRAADGSIVAPGHGVVDFDTYFGALAAADVRVPVIAHGLAPADACQAALFLRGRLS